MSPSRFRSRFVARFASGLALALIVLSGCRSGDEASPQGGETPVAAVAAEQLVTAMISDPKTFNPILVTDSGSREALDNVFDGLLRMNPVSLQMEPALATRWESSSDGTVWTFELRRDVRWHDGQPFTAADVVFTYDAIFDPRVPNSSKHILTIDGQPLRTEAIDDFTVRFTLPRPFAPLLSVLQESIVPKHLLGKALADGTFAQQWGINTPPEQIVGTGPYRLTQYLQAQYLRFQRNPAYWMRDESGAALPYLEQRAIVLVPDMDTAYLKFVSGQTTIHLPRPEEIADLRGQVDKLSIQVDEIGLSTSAQFVTFNRNPGHYVKDGVRDPRLDWFTDRRFMRALAHAIDKKAMVLNCLAGYGEAAVSGISPSDAVFHNPTLVDYVYDLGRSRQLLAEAGYSFADGVLRDQGGRAVEFSLTTNSGNKIRERIGVILQADWGKLGIKVNFRPVDFTTLVEKLDTTFDWDAILIGFTSSPEPHNGANLLRSTGNLHMWHPNQKAPATPWEAEIDQLLEAGSRELDPTKRRQPYWRIQAILHEELPMLQTVRGIDHVAYRRHLRHFRRTVWGTDQPERLTFAP